MDKTTERVPGSSIDDLQKLSIEELTDEEIVAILRARFKSKFALVAYERDGDYLFVSTYAPGGLKMVSNLQKAWSEKFGHIEVL
ncbi:Hypothetical protein PEIBARAKI_5325 [Petrimonas sp. IBARAKI]|jgi:hypothetical protein|nr:Hypothetical protein PEIBARAKI_5325 [Petrimonas sp. IBARAKI]